MAVNGTLWLLNLRFHLVFKTFNRCGLLSFWMLIDSRVFCCVDDVEKVIGLLLKEAGDRLNEEVRNVFSSDVKTFMSLNLLDHVVGNSYRN